MEKKETKKYSLDEVIELLKVHNLTAEQVVLKNTLIAIKEKSFSKLQLPDLPVFTFKFDVQYKQEGIAEETPEESEKKTSKKEK